MFQTKLANFKNCHFEVIFRFFFLKSYATLKPYRTVNTYFKVPINSSF
jgi:hypothetical protein